MKDPRILRVVARMVDSEVNSEVDRRGRIPNTGVLRLRLRMTQVEGDRFA
jgi:hypothetical protein